MIEAAIGEAEQKTAGEIVPVVATASGRYDRGEDLFGLVALCLVAVLVRHTTFEPIAWFDRLRQRRGPRLGSKKGNMPCASPCGLQHSAM